MLNPHFKGKVVCQIFSNFLLLPVFEHLSFHPAKIQFPKIVIHQVTQVVYPDDTTHEGDPYHVLQSTAVGCLTGDVVLLAEIRFEWLLEGEESFPVSAGAASPAVDCDGTHHVLMGLAVDIVGTTAQVSRGTESWGSLKAAYSGE